MRQETKHSGIAAATIAVTIPAAAICRCVVLVELIRTVAAVSKHGPCDDMFLARVIPKESISMHPFPCLRHCWHGEIFPSPGGMDEAEEQS